MSRGKIIFIVTALLIVLIGLYMQRDLALSGDPSGGKLPPIMVEHPDFVRRINGREWHVRAENAESDGDAVRASSIDIRVSEINAAQSADINAHKGSFDLEGDKMWLYEVTGTVYLSDGGIDIAAPRADYDMSKDVWFFSEGVSASDDKIHVTGRVGRIDPSGAVILGKGVRAGWKLE